MNDPLFPLLLVLRYFHILGAITLMGGSLLLRLGVRPAVRELETETRQRLHERLRPRWAQLVMLSSALLLLSGLTNLALAGRYDYEPILGMKQGYHLLVGIKFLFALPIFLIASLLAGRSPLAQRLQARPEPWMNLALTLALVMVLLGGWLRFVPRERKGAAAQGATSSVVVPAEHRVATGPAFAR
jgi:uncharacterized membrane protein